MCEQIRAEVRMGKFDENIYLTRFTKLANVIIERVLFIGSNNDAIRYILPYFKRGLYNVFIFLYYQYKVVFQVFFDIYLTCVQTDVIFQNY